LSLFAGGEGGACFGKNGGAQAPPNLGKQFLIISFQFSINDHFAN